jgi:GcrA cell cycle regulator
MPQSFWTEQRIDELKTRWANGESCTAIGIAMSNSRNAVIGKIHRLGLGGARPVTKIAPAAMARPRPRRRRLNYCDGHYWQGDEAVIEDKPAPKFKNPKPFSALAECDCRWPGAGEPGPELLFCAAPKLNGYPYCLAHCRIAYVKPSPRPRTQ